MSLILLLAASIFANFGNAATARQTTPPQRILNLCYVSLNNRAEFEQTKAFVDRIQNITGKKLIQVQEFQEQGAAPQDTLKKMISSGTVCDGLVISGHHTGQFGGAAAGGTLSINMLERMSCTPENSNWFTQIKALWLQGCRTLGAVAEIDRDGQDLADFHANRVNAVRQQDHIDENQWQLMEDFSTILDTETPYAARFLKVFWQADIFGWTETAPGEISGSDKSFPYHIHNMARHLFINRPGLFFKGPFSPDMTRAQADAYQQALIKLLSDKSARSVYSAVRGWIDHGHPKPQGGIFGLDNPHLNAHYPLAKTNNQSLLHARDLECRMRSEDESVKLQAVREGIKSEKDVALSFYALRDAVSDDSLFTTAQIKREMQESRALKAFLSAKLRQKNLGLARKAEYYAFYRDLTGQEDTDLAEQIKTEAIKLIHRPPPQNDEVGARDLKATVIQTLVGAQIFTAKDVTDLIADSTDDSFITTLIYNMPFGDSAATSVITQAVYGLRNRSNLVTSALVSTLSKRPFLDKASLSILGDLFRMKQSGQIKIAWVDFSTGSSPGDPASVFNLEDIVNGIMSEYTGPVSSFNPWTLTEALSILGASQIAEKFRHQAADKILSILQASHVDDENTAVTLAKFLLSRSVQADRYPEIASYLAQMKSVLPAETSALEYNGTSIVAALARAHDSRAEAVASAFWTRVRNEQTNGQILITILKNDLTRHGRFLRPPVPLVEQVVSSSRLQSDSAMPIASGIISVMYPKETELDLLMKLYKNPRVTVSDRNFMLMALGRSQMPTADFRALINAALKSDPRSQILRTFTVAAGLTRQDLYKNLTNYVDRLQNLQRGEPYFYGVAVLAYLNDPTLSPERRSQKIKALMDSEDFTEQSLSILSPYTVRFLNISISSPAYLDVLRRVTHHRYFTRYTRKDFIEAIQYADLMGGQFLSPEDAKTILRTLSD